MEIVRKRIDESGTKEPLIQRSGKDRILLQLPGVKDPERIKDLLGKTAQLNFRLIFSIIFFLFKLKLIMVRIVYTPYPRSWEPCNV